jgi:ABC-2 type transport system permease protein
MATPSEALVTRREAVATTPRADAVRNYVQEVSALSWRWFLYLRRDRLNLIFSLAQPAIWLIFFGGVMQRSVDKSVIDAPDYITFMSAGIIVFTVVGNSVSGAVPLLFDRERGLLSKLMTTPISRSSLIVSRFLFQMVLSAVQSVVIVCVALALGVSFESGFVGVLVILAIAGLLGMSLTAAFLALAYNIKSHGDFFALTGFITIPLLFMSSAFAPLDVMPGWMEVIARLNPLTYAIGAVRALVITGWPSSLYTDVLILTGFAALCLYVGTMAFRRSTA